MSVNSNDKSSQILNLHCLIINLSILLQSGMSCTNNVRKVMNVEISSRFNNNPSITFINNDLVLEWWKDDVKKMRLFCSDGFSLTAYGFSVMLDHWMVSNDYFVINFCMHFNVVFCLPGHRFNLLFSGNIKENCFKCWYWSFLCKLLLPRQQRREFKSSSIFWTRCLPWSIDTKTTKTKVCWN